MLGQPVRHGQGGLLGRIRPALYKESLAWLIQLSFGSVERGEIAEFKKCTKWLKYEIERYPIFDPGLTPNAGQPFRHGQGSLLGRIRLALYKESLAWLILLSFRSVEKRRNCRVQEIHQVI